MPDVKHGSRKREPNQSWDNIAADREALLQDMIGQSARDAERAINLGEAGSKLLQWAGSQAAQIPRVASQIIDTSKDISNIFYLLDQGASDSSLVIGPIRFSHSVQNIQISEQKAVTAPKVVRSDNPLVIDGGIARHTATVTFLFSGLDEINTFARGLVALFRVTPIISVRNEMISSEWSPKQSDLLEKAASRVANTRERIKDQKVRNEIYKDLADAIRENKLTDKYISVLQRNFADRGVSVSDESAIIAKELITYRTNTKFIPVALDSLSVQTVPDLPETLYITLVMSKTDVSSATETGALEYLGTAPGKRHADPRRAYWLKNYLGTLLNGDPFFLPRLEKRHFETVEFKFFDKPLSEVPQLALEQKPKPLIFNTERIGDDSKKLITKISGQSATITNYFGHQRLIGKSTTCVHHMGTSARSLSADIQFVTGNEGDDAYERFNEFKDLSSELVRSEAEFDRIMGWEIASPVSMLLGGSTSKLQATKHGVFVPLASTTDTGDVPHLKNTSITFQETNTSFQDSYQIILDSGGSNLADMRDFFMGRVYSNGIKSGVTIGEVNKRARIPRSIVLGTNPTPNSWELSAWEAFWPVDKGFSFAASGKSAILNRDVFRAALLTSIFDKGGKLRSALKKTVLISGKLMMERSPNTWNSIKLGAKYILSDFPGILVAPLSGPDIADSRVKLAAGEIANAISRVFVGDTALSELSNAIKDPEKRDNKKIQAFFNSRDKETILKREILDMVLSSITGDPRKMDDLLIRLASSELEFSEDFKKSIFYVITRRPKAISTLPHLYRQTGLFEAWTVFHREYKVNRHLYPGFADKRSDEAIRSANPQWRHSTYRDFSFLPTYRGLFGDDWRKYAPTFDDLGVNVFRSRLIVRPTFNETIDALHDKPAVLPDDKVPPHIWFYKPRRKPNIRDSLSTLAKRKGDRLGGVLNSIDNLHLSMNITSLSMLEKVDREEAIRLSDINQQLLEEFASQEDNNIWGDDGKVKDKYKQLVDTLEDIIRRGYTKNNEFSRVNLQEDFNKVETLLDAARPNDQEPTKPTNRWKNFYDTFIDPKSPRALSIYVHSSGRPITNEGEEERNLISGNIPTIKQLERSFGAGILRLIHRRKFTFDKESRYTVDDGSGTTSGAANNVFSSHGSDTDIGYTRNLKKNIDFTVRSSLTQIPDDFESPAKLWPTAKIYFIDRRGDEVLADDVLFTTDSLLSIDVTLDKDDAALAVIKLGDPLRTIQNSTFFESNILNAGAKRVLTDTGVTTRKGEKYVLGNKKDRQRSFFKSRKIEQGRPVMIKMGYDSVAENLHTVFTGRISEIELGDTVTLVCQGWKAELINRHVNFYTKDKNNWGPKDMAVLAMQLADPDGFGAHYNQEDAMRIMDTLDERADRNQIERILSKVQEGTQNVYGYDSFMSWLYNSDNVVNLGLLEDARMWEGLDTRLKNIWYPDISKNVNNWAFWKRIMGYPPDFVNMQWIIPLQPCWDVLKEAARHTWNYIVQVVPYDNESTLYFGHPDGLYYYTKGNREIQKNYRQFANKVNRGATRTILEDLISGFITSDIEKGRIIPSHFFTPRGAGLSLPVHYLRGLDDKTDFLSHLKYHYYWNIHRTDIDATKFLSFSLVSRISSTEEGAKIVKSRILESSLPWRSYLNLRDKLGNEFLSFVYAVMFGMDPEKIRREWHSYINDSEALLKGGVHTKGLLRRDTRNGTTLDRVSNLARNKKINAEEIREIVTSMIDPMLERLSKSPTGLASGSTLLDIALLEMGGGTRLLKPEPKAVPYYPLPEIHQLRTALFRLPENNTFVRRIIGASDKLPLTGGVLDNRPDKDNARRNLRLIRSQLLRLTDRSAVQDVLESAEGSFPLFEIAPDAIIGDIIEEYGHLVKAFIYFLDQYTKQPGVKIENSVVDAFYDLERTAIAPNLRAFRVHHYISSDRDILSNNIVASTSQMWNSVIINYPQGDPSDLSSAGGRESLGRGAKVSGTTSWVYWPPTSSSKVIGLQFHPGMTISNKKLRTFTELNCGSEPLASKLACNRMAEGVRKMYIGTLAIRGRHIKPHDRIILNDKFTGMRGPIEVESVVHHFNPDMGWVSNIRPCAICDSNPGAAAVQTAMMEAGLRAANDTVEWVFTALNIALIAFTGGGALLATTGRGLWTVFTRAGLGTAKQALFGEGLKGAAGSLLNFGKVTLESASAALTKAGFAAGSRNPFHIASMVADKYSLGKLGSRIMLSYLLEETGQSLLHHLGSSATQHAWMEGHKGRAEQLPVILSPLMFNGLPWTAGLESDEVLFTVPFYDMYYSFAAIVEGMHKLVSTDYSIPSIKDKVIGPK